MALPLPNLDDRSYADLVAEARALIPALAPDWTNHNPSDPGVTLVELFAWLTEMLIYRTNQVPDRNLQAFLELLNGPEWRASRDPEALEDPGKLAEEVRVSVTALREEYRAVTPGDFEALSTGAFNLWVDAAPRPVSRIARARCVPRRYLGAGTEEERARDRPGQVSVLVLPEAPAAGSPVSATPPPAPDWATRQALWGFLEERRLLATRVHVLGPVYVPVRVEVVVVAREDVPDPFPPEVLRGGWSRVPDTDLRKAVAQALDRYLDPLRGGADGKGWPLGRDVYVSDLYRVLEGVPGVDHVTDLRVTSPCPEGAEGCVSAPESWHESGEQVGLSLAEHHLPRLRPLDPAAVHVVRRALPVRVEVSLTPAASASAAGVRRAVREAVRRTFHPGHDGPDGEEGGDVTVAAVRTGVRRLAEVDSRQKVEVRLEADPARLRVEDSVPVAVRLEAGEAADVTLQIRRADGSIL